jgi:hypothetical protein
LACAGYALAAPGLQALAGLAFARISPTHALTIRAVFREWFEGMDLLHRDDGRVEIRPVLRPAQRQRFLDRGDFPMGVTASENNPHTRT